MPRLSVTIDPGLLEQVRRLAGVRTKREALAVALAEFIRRREVKRLRDLEGSGVVSMSPRNLRVWRQGALRRNR